MDPGNTGISIIMGNREIECSLGRQNVGISIYVDHDKQFLFPLSLIKRQLVVLWRSRNRQCESIVLTPSLQENTWMHFVVVFKQVDMHGKGGFEDSGRCVISSSWIDEYLSPTKVTCFVNGILITTATSNRFFSYDDHNYFLGSSPTGLHPFSGRLFYLMVIYSTMRHV